ncbi:hypothetical protein [Burkholderia sp. F1]|uniref:hypothetical protein n=1 Tax=Burkholderia sp. F1 TaxID=3366817 RepID=UPI003D7477A0
MIDQVTALPPQPADLERAASEQGFSFIGRLIDEWRDGSNRFDKPGECLLMHTANAP